LLSRLQHRDIARTLLMFNINKTLYSVLEEGILKCDTDMVTMLLDAMAEQVKDQAMVSWNGSLETLELLKKIGARISEHDDLTIEIMRSVALHSEFDIAVRISEIMPSQLSRQGDNWCLIHQRNNAELDLSLIHTIEIAEPPASFRFSTDAKYLGICYLSGTIKIFKINSSTGLGDFSVEELAEYRSLVDTNPGSRVCFSPDCLHIAVGHITGSIQIWQLLNGGQKSMLGPGSVLAIDISQDCKRLVSAFSTGAIWLTDLETGQVLREWSIGHSCYSIEIALSQDDQFIAAAEFGLVTIWNTISSDLCAEFQAFQDGNNIETLAFSNTENLRLYYGSHNGTIDCCKIARDLDLGTAKVTKDLERTSKRFVFSVAVSPDNELLAGAVSDQAVWLWKPDDKMVQSVLRTSRTGLFSYQMKLIL
jgi:WD40 repeat protein